MSIFRFEFNNIIIHNTPSAHYNMGSQPSRQSEQTININHLSMKKTKFLRNNEIMRVSISIENEQQFDKWQQKLHKLSNYDEYYLLLPKAYVFEKKAICGSSGILQVDYDNYPYLLCDELNNRIPNANYFSQTQLWYLLYGLVSAANIFKKIDSKIGDVRANNIFINQEGQIKVSNLCSWPNEHTNYEKLVFEHISTYVAPEELHWVKDGRVDIYKTNKSSGPCDKYLCQSFSIGLTLLQCFLLSPSASLYTSKGQFLDRQQLNKRINTLLQLNSNNKNMQYSPSIRAAIASLCEYEANSRLSAIELYEMIKQHDSQLTNLKPCIIELPTLRRYQEIVNNPRTVIKPENNAHHKLSSNSNQQITYTNAGSHPININNNIVYNANSNLNSYHHSIGSNYLPSSSIQHSNFIANTYPNYSQSYGANYAHYPANTTIDNTYKYTNNYSNSKNDSYSYSYKYSSINPSYSTYLSSIDGNTYNIPYANNPYNINNKVFAHNYLFTNPNPINSYDNKYKPNYQSNYYININTNNLAGNINSLQNTIPKNNQEINKPINNPANTDVTFNTKSNDHVFTANKQKPTSTQTNHFYINSNQPTTNNANYNFSNISSIPKHGEYTFNSGNKIMEEINAFTPTHTIAHVNNTNTINKDNDDSSLDLLQKINEEILRSKQKYSGEREQ